MSARPAPSARRARTALPPDDRRAAIIDAVVPVLAEYGPQATSAQLAAAADVSEGTIFHVFEDKKALIDAAVAHVVRTDDLVRAIGALQGSGDLRARLAACATVVVEHLLRVMPIVMKCGAPDHGDAHPWVPLREAITQLVDPDAASLNLPAPMVAGAFLGLCLASAQQELFDDGARPGASGLVELFLDGALVRSPVG